jgi:hypothetical protein
LFYVPIFSRATMRRAVLAPSLVSKESHTVTPLPPFLPPLYVP